LRVGGREPALLIPGLTVTEAPDWSPDGSEIAFHGAQPGNTSGASVMVIPAEGGTPVVVSGSPGNHTYPRWSLSGLEILFNFRDSARREKRVAARDSMRAPWREAVPLQPHCRNSGQ